MKMPTKILFLLHLPPPVHGSSIVGLSIVKGEIINKNFNCNFFNLLASANVSESGSISQKKLLAFFVTSLKILILLIRNRPQVCYLALSTTGAAFYKDVFLVALLKIFRVSRIYHLHNKGVSQFQHQPVYRFCYRFVFRNAKVILLSKLLYSDIQLFVPESHVYICPNGISNDTSQFQLQDGVNVNNKKIKVPNTIDNETIKIFFLSNMFESKGVFILLEACEILKKKEISFECIFAGGEGDITALQFNKQVNQRGLSNYVSYKGVILGMDKYNAFSEADIIVFPTYKDCFPLVLLEALSYSLPIISTFEGGIPDIIENNVNGFLVPKQDPKSLAEKLEYLINNPKLRIQMGKTGYKTYNQKFTSEIFENRLSEILFEVAANK